LGGPKKPTLSQLGKRAARQAAAGRGGEGREKAVSSVLPPPMEEVLEFVRSQPYLTSSILAEKFGIRISTAKQVLSGLVGKGYVKLVQGDSRLRIYEPITEAFAAEEKPKKEKKAKAKK